MAVVTCSGCSVKWDRPSHVKRLKCPECHRSDVYAARAKRRAEQPEVFAEEKFNNRLWTLFRLRREDYDAMLESQGHACAVCKQTNRHSRGFHVDHDHSCCPTNRSCGRCVRGILCNGCNAALGHAEDDPERLRALIQYLEFDRLPSE